MRSNTLEFATAFYWRSLVICRQCQLLASVSLRISTPDNEPTLNQNVSLTLTLTVYGGRFFFLSGSCQDIGIFLTWP